MSRSDHPIAPRDQRTQGERVRGVQHHIARRHHKMPTARQDVHQRVLDMLPEMGLRPLLPGIICQRPGVLNPGKRTRRNTYSGLQRDLTRYVEQTPGYDTHWREVRLSECEHGCKVHERIYQEQVEIQVQHNRTYGCKRNDGPIKRISHYTDHGQPPVVQHVVARRNPVSDSFRYSAYGDLTRNRYAVIDTPEPPSLMQMAKARAEALGLSK